jgi:hypothetical protein
LHIPKQFNKDCYNVIKTFQGKRIINVPLHAWELQAPCDEIYVQLMKELKKNIVGAWSNLPFMKDFCKDLITFQETTKNDNNLVNYN